MAVIKREVDLFDRHLVDVSPALFEIIARCVGRRMGGAIRKITASYVERIVAKEMGLDKTTTIRCTQRKGSVIRLFPMVTGISLLDNSMAMVSVSMRLPLMGEVCDQNSALKRIMKEMGLSRKVEVKNSAICMDFSLSGYELPVETDRSFSPFNGNGQKHYALSSEGVKQ